MTHFHRSFVVAAALAAIGVGVHAQSGGDGLKAAGSDTLWPRWQVRLLADLATPLWRNAAGGEAQGLRLESLGLLGDYYFTAALPSTRMVSGFRATSGLIIGAPTNRVLSSYGQSGASPRITTGASLPTEAANSPVTVPYLGLGYTSASQRGGWGFSADIGLVAHSPGSVVKFGRVLSGTQNLDDLLRDMRLAPLLNVGVSYSF